MPKKKTTKKTNKKKEEQKKHKKIPQEKGTFFRLANEELANLRKKRQRDVELDDQVEEFAKDLDKFLATATKTSVQSLSERDDIPYWINTNCMALNWVISNDFNKGLPGTKAIVISGKTGKGKSLLLDNILGENIVMGGVSYKLDIEDAGTESFTSKIVASEKIASKIRIISPKDIQAKTALKDQVITIEKLTQILNKAIDFQISSKKKNKSVVFGIDSVTQLTSEKEYEKVVKEKKAKDMTPAVKMRELFRTLTQKFKQSNITTVGLAQLTANVGVIFGSPTVENLKGTGYLYASSLNLQMMTDKPILTSIDGGSEIPIGIKMRMKTTKNRVEFKGREAWLYFYFNKGIDSYGGLIELLSQFGVFKASAKPSVIGEYEYSNTFKWEHPDTTEEHTFKILTFNKFMTDLQEDERKELLAIWNLQLNLKWENITKDWDEASLLADDGPGDDEFLDDIERE